MPAPVPAPAVASASRGAVSYVYQRLGAHVGLALRLSWPISLLLLGPTFSIEKVSVKEIRCTEHHTNLRRQLLSFSNLMGKGTECSS